MPEHNVDHLYRRRAEDLTETGGPPTAQDAWHRAGLAHKRLNDFEAKGQAYERAFVKDDLGTPDYEGHRKAHLALMEAEKVLQGYKQEATKKMLGWFVALLLGAMGSGLMVWIQTHFK